MHCEHCGDLLEVTERNRMIIWVCSSCGHIQEMYSKKHLPGLFVSLGDEVSRGLVRRGRKEFYT